MADRVYAHSFATTVEVDADPEQVFDEFDDHERVSAHMMNSSLMMAGSKMRIDLDEAKGRAVGSKIRMAGDIMGFHLELDEVVIQRDPPRRKVWQTIGRPRLLVIGDYRMGFTIEPSERGSSLSVFIEYDEPPPPWRWLGRLLGPVYARWCTVNMAKSAAKRFGSGI